VHGAMLGGPILWRSCPGNEASRRRWVIAYRPDAAGESERE
jgi:hypothetical protein